MPTALPASRHAAPLFLRAAASPAAVLRLLRRWSERYRQRRDLGELDDRLLDDVGLTRRQAEEEQRKPPWR